MGLAALAFTIFTAVNVVEFHLKSTWNSTINVKDTIKIHYQAQFYYNTQYTTFRFSTSVLSAYKDRLVFSNVLP